jgi:hypothetical protein
MEGSGLHEDEEIASVSALISMITARSLGAPEIAGAKAHTALVGAAAGDFGLSASDVQALAEKLQPDESAIIILFENAWERRFKQAAKKRGGAVVDQRLISSKVLAESARRLMSS